MNNRRDGVSVVLVMRRTIAASPVWLFNAWTEPAHLRQWWGPAGVDCPEAEVDLRVGGAFRIGNRFPDGKLLWIIGEFEAVEPPRRLVYSWRIEAQAGPPERVTVRFTPKGAATEVTVLHERIPDAATRAQHRNGWRGCLTGLARHAASAPATKR